MYPLEIAIPNLLASCLIWSYPPVSIPTLILLADSKAIPMMIQVWPRLNRPHPI